MYLVGFVRHFRRSEWEVIIEDDDRVAYAYLVRDGRIVADVWLYNRMPAPQWPPWSEPQGEMPFLNSALHIAGDGFPRSPLTETLSVLWSDPSQPEPEITIQVDNHAIAWLAPGTRPGWSALVVLDGPLARIRTR
jgi:hypothetical protein